MSDVKTATRLAKVLHIAGPVEPALGSLAAVAPSLAKATAGWVARDTLEVVINQSTKQGVKHDDRFIVSGIGPHIIDPETGKDHGELELIRGQGVVTHVQDELATLRPVERSRTRPPKRIIREADASIRFFSNGRVLEEELAPEIEMPFQGVCLGDFARKI